MTLGCGSSITSDGSRSSTVGMERRGRHHSVVQTGLPSLVLASVQTPVRCPTATDAVRPVPLHVISLPVTTDIVLPHDPLDPDYRSPPLAVDSIGGPSRPRPLYSFGHIGHVRFGILERFVCLIAH